ncbi:MAG: hypothetical protein NC904_03565 [Candidatus Omnitrophica bacterium]|nr:hypothetical protein [Candidatus Omnitrophota bacterium]
MCISERLKQKVIKAGLQELLRSPHPAPNKIPEKIIKTVVFLRQKYYYDFNLMHFKDKLEENHKIKLSYESIREILIKEGLYTPVIYLCHMIKIFTLSSLLKKNGLLILTIQCSFMNR